MPNHCYNRIDISGPRQTLESLLEAIKYNDKDGIALSNLYPCPHELYNHSHYEWNGVPEIWKTFVEKGEMTQDEYDKKVEEFQLSKVKSQENIQKYGYPSWYEWCLSHWGNKWGDYDHNVTIPVIEDGNDGNATISFSYDTAWAPFDVPFWEKVSSDYPDLTFLVEFEETGMDFLGASIATQGICLMETDDIGFEWPDEYDDQDLSNFYDHMRKKIEALVDSVQFNISRQLPEDGWKE